MIASNILHATTSKLASVKSEITAGLISSAVAIPLSMAFGMFALVSLGDKYFANDTRPHRPAD